MDWEQRLAVVGCRITAPRRAVMQVMVQANVPLSPQEIQEQAREMHRDLGLVTVYRTLNLLAGLNLVRRAHREDGRQDGYLLVSPGHHHVVICQTCGGATEFPGEDDMRALIRRVETGTGFQVNDHLLQLFGLCPECRGTEI